MSKRTFEAVYKDWLDNKGTQSGDTFLKEYEMLVLEQERKRNLLLFGITIIVAMISLANLIIAIIELKNS